MALEAQLKVTTGRALPLPAVDDMPDAVRGGRYGEVVVMPVMTSKHLLADEGSYFTTSNGSQTGLLSSAATGFVATTPACIIANTDSTGNAKAMRVYIDYLNLVTTVVGSAASGLVNVQMAVYMDDGNRYSSGGTEITANKVSTNSDVGVSASIAKVYFGAITATAATANVRAVSPLRILRACVSATVADVVGEQKLLSFGNIDPMLNGSITVANANNIPISLPPVVIGPGKCALIYIWQNVGGTNVAATYAPELAWFER